MFDSFILKVIRSPLGRRTIEAAVREILEDPASSTRRGMMRIIRGEAKDAIEDANERGQALAELDTEYVQWAQQRREALLEQQNSEKTAAAAAAMAELLDVEPPAPIDVLKQFTTGARVRVISDALFENKYGRVVGTERVLGYPQVTVLLDHHTVSTGFTPAALQLLDDVQDAEQPTDDPRCSTCNELIMWNGHRGDWTHRNFVAVPHAVTQKTCSTCSAPIVWLETSKEWTHRDLEARTHPVMVPPLTQDAEAATEMLPTVES